MPYKNHIIKLINHGKLTIKSVKWYLGQGYYFICNDGKVTDIIYIGE